MTGTRETLEQSVRLHDELIANIRLHLRQVARLKDGSGRKEFVFETADDVWETLEKMRQR